MKIPVKALLVGGLAALALAVSGVGAAPAAAGTPCWKTLLNDWYDGRIDGTYQLHCYRDALKHLPTDVSNYSSARDDIERALQSALAAAKKSGHAASGSTLVKPAKGSKKTSTVAKSRKDGRTITVSEPKRKKSKGLAGLADRVDPGGPSSLPVPLLVLGGLAILLVAAGGAGLLVKRYQNRGL